MRDLELPPMLLGLQRFEGFAEVREVLRSSAFDAVAHTDEAAFLLQGTLVAIDGDDHQARRRIESGLVAPTALERYEEHILAPAVKRRIQGCPISVDGFRRADLVPFIRLLSMEVGAQIVGVDVSAEERLVAFAKLADRITEGARVQWMKMDGHDLIREAREAKRVFVQEFFEPAWQQRSKLVQRSQAGEFDQSELPIDLITLLAVHDQQLRAFRDWDDDLYVREALLFVIASAFTIAMSVSHAVAHLTEWVARHPEDEAKLVDQDFLRRAANEALRLHHSSPANLRRANADATLSTGRHVTAGELVAVIEGSAGLDAAAFGPDAAEFNPNRDPRPRPWAAAFGEGHHTCLGQTLAIGAGRGSRTSGAVILILRDMFQAGLERDPESPPVPSTRTFADFYSSFPVIFRTPFAVRS
jgi:cytochrome P450